MGSYKIKLKFAKTFEEKEIKFPIYLKTHLSYYQFCTAESYIEVNFYDNKITIEYYNACPDDYTELLQKFLQDELYKKIDKKEFDDFFEKAEKWIKKWRDDNY